MKQGRIGHPAKISVLDLNGLVQARGSRTMDEMRARAKQIAASIREGEANPILLAAFRDSLEAEGFTGEEAIEIAELAEPTK